MCKNIMTPAPSNHGEASIVNIHVINIKIEILQELEKLNT